ncbi:hypothetical protein U9M48_030984 [Paspalum notatum var. saurae]|uniref:Uncharacterized protein n=1 Tax=Paspalum notatum var. saurae TaxID=547442 RepID=A0AAQ3U244_PASNO
MVRVNGFSIVRDPTMAATPDDLFNAAKLDQARNTNNRVGSNLTQLTFLPEDSTHTHRVSMTQLVCSTCLTLSFPVAKPMCLLPLDASPALRSILFPPLAPAR